MNNSSSSSSKRKREANVGHLAPFVAASLRDAVVADMVQDRRELDDRLLGVRGAARW